MVIEARGDLGDWAKVLGFMLGWLGGRKTCQGWGLRAGETRIGLASLGEGEKGKRKLRKRGKGEEKVE